MAESGSLTRDNIAHFDQHAASWDTKPHIARLASDASEYLVSHLGLTSTTTLLDFGCGTGLLSSLLAPRVARVYGCDTSSAMVAAYNSKAAERGITNMTAACCNILDQGAVTAAQAADSLPASVDVVVAHMTLHHVEQVPAVLAALGALLAPAGRLVITDLLHTPDSERFHAHNVHTVSHHGGFSQQQLQEFLAPAGMEVASFDGAALVMTKQMAAGPDGGTGDEQFPIFCAVASRQQ
jgi:2-polyprenyl-3-methyl-5-hydroxy-6-metoxy-1,4-benzoquinol methylase